jgi:hypothetical protein
MEVLIVRKNFVLCTLILVVITSVVLIAACGGSNKTLLVGLWKDKGGSNYVEIFNDGYFVASFQPTNGKYTILDDGRIRFEGADGSSVLVVGYTVSETELFLHESGREDRIYIRHSN